MKDSPLKDQATRVWGIGYGQRRRDDMLLSMHDPQFLDTQGGAV